MSCLLLFVLSLFFSLGRGVWFPSKEQEVLDMLLEEFSSNSDHYRYDSVVNTGLVNSRCLPKIFIWCPIQHNGIKVLCPVHHSQLKFEKWTSRVDGRHANNPRLVYDLGGNIILIQACYVCRHGDRFLSASKDILDSLPSQVKESFPFRVSHRSACSNCLLDFLITSLTMGHSFLDITESLLAIKIIEPFIAYMELPRRPHFTTAHCIQVQETIN